MKPETLEELKKIASRYANHGVTVDDLIPIVSNHPDEITERAMVIGLRIVMADTYGENDRFSINDICEISGVTPDEVRSIIKKLNLE